MKIHCKYKDIKGITTVYRDALRYRYMITEQALRKAKILVFAEKHGIDMALEAFEVKKRTFFAWKKKWIDGCKMLKSFFLLCLKVFPFSVAFVLTDNGSEFMKCFDEELKRLHMLHYHTYSKTPKMNSLREIPRPPLDIFMISAIILHRTSTLQIKGIWLKRRIR